MLVGVRLTPRAYVSPAATHAPARRRRSVIPAVDWRVISRSQRFVPKPRRTELAWSLRPRDTCSNRMYARARILGHAFIPWVVAPPACLFWSNLCGCPDAGSGPGWVRSGVLYSGPSSDCIRIRHRVRNLMFITVARASGRGAGACAWDLISQDEHVNVARRSSSAHLNRPSATRSA